MHGRYELIACVPKTKGILPPSPQALHFLEDLGVSIVEITNPLPTHHPIGNKFGCLDIPGSGAYKVFLESDILCRRPIYGLLDLEGAEFAAKLEDWNHHGLEEMGDPLPTF